MFGASKASSVTTETTVLTAEKDIYITGLTICPNTDVANNPTVNLKFDSAYILKNTTISNGTTIAPLGGLSKLLLKTSEIIAVEADYPIDVIITYQEV